MGSGGVGGYFGTRLAAAGNEVAFIARGAHLEAIRSHGIRLLSDLGDVHLQPVRATDDPGTIGPVDIVLFATKLYDTETAGERCRPLLGAETAVISLLNGIDSELALARILGHEHVAGGVAYISAAITAPGVIQHNGSHATLELGELDGSTSPRLERLADAARRAGVDVRLSTSIEVAIWRKFVMLASMAALCALTRLPIGPVRDTPQCASLLRASVAEVAAVGRASGIALPDDTVQEALEVLDGFPGHIKASMLVDLERGNRLELDWLSGAVCRLGEKLGVDTPVHRVAWGALMPHADGCAG